MKWICMTIVLALTSCVSMPTLFNDGDPGPCPNKFNAIMQARVATKAVLLNPESAIFQYQNMTTSNGYWLLNFRVNARNMFNGRTGFQDWRARFAAGRLIALELGEVRWRWNTPYTKWRTVATFKGRVE